MKFFTRDYCEGRLSDAEREETHRKYRQHLEALRVKLPAAVHALASLPLHDGLIEQVLLDTSAHTAAIAIVGGDPHAAYERFVLEYSAAELSDQDRATLRAAAEDPESALLYDELDELRGDRFEHRLVFTPFRQIAIRFTNIVISRKPLPAREVRTSPAERFTEIGAA